MLQKTVKIVKELAAPLGVQELSLYTHADAVPAHQLYEKHGFIKDAQEGTIDGDPIFIYRLKL